METITNWYNKNCFIAGTKILMEDGTEKNIEDVVGNDVVMSYNVSLQINEPRVVISTKTTTQLSFVTYTLENGKEITCTPDHPFYTENYTIGSFSPSKTIELIEYQDWYDNLLPPIEQISIGDNLVDNLGNKVKIVNITQVAGSMSTYLFTVESNNNFYANSILVHN